jgi:nucleoside-diphosphate-sugar epimerase
VVSVRVFVTGGSGYIGREVIRALGARGDSVLALARTDAAGDAVEELGAIAVRGSLTDDEALTTVAGAVDAVIHLGFAGGPDAAAVDAAAAAALQDGIGTKPYVHTSGAWVWGSQPEIVDEDAPHRPPALTAWRPANEARVLARARSGGHPVIVAPGIVYGPDRDGRSAGLAVAALVDPGRSAHEVWSLGDGGQHWSLVHVEDVAALYVRALGAPRGRVYAGVTEDQPVSAIATALAVAAGPDVAVRSVADEEAAAALGPLTEALLLDNRVSGARARAELGWSPVHTDALVELSRPAETV